MITITFLCRFYSQSIHMSAMEAVCNVADKLLTIFPVFFDYAKNYLRSHYAGGRRCVFPSDGSQKIAITTPYERVQYKRPSSRRPSRPYKNYAPDVSDCSKSSHRTEHPGSHTLEVEPVPFHVYSLQDHPPSSRTGQPHRCLSASSALRVLQWNNNTSPIEDLFMVSAPNLCPTAA